MEHSLGINLQDAEGHRLPPSSVKFWNCLSTACGKLLVFLIWHLILVKKEEMALYASEKFKGVNSASLRQYWPLIRIILIGRKLIKSLTLKMHIFHSLLILMVNKLYQNPYVTLNKIHVGNCYVADWVTRIY